MALREVGFPMIVNAPEVTTNMLQMAFVYVRHVESVHKQVHCFYLVFVFANSKIWGI